MENTSGEGFHLLKSNLESLKFQHRYNSHNLLHLLDKASSN